MTNKLYVWSDLDAQERKAILDRPSIKDASSKREIVANIISKVKSSGDEALKLFAAEFDGVQVNEIKVTEEKIDASYGQVSSEFIRALRVAASNIKKFHSAYTPKSINIEVMPGVRCKKNIRAIKSVGLYVPAGTAPLPSTVLMLGIPAKLAGVPNIVLCSPPNSDGEIDPAVLVAAKEIGITDVYVTGGAQAVAAMAYGTETIPKVEKVFGPGNTWVTEAKQQVAMDPKGAALDMPAGPSEVMVVADESANPDFIASDLLSQAEHGVDSQAILVTGSAILFEQVMKCLDEQLKTLPRRKIAEQALVKSRFILSRDKREMLQIVNDYAPEHLILQIDGAENFSDNVDNAGSIFLGPYSAESFGDYASGTNHVLPTYGYAKAYSGLSIDDFIKTITVQEISKQGLRALGPTVEILAQAEGLIAHKNAISIRLASLGDE
jgi:histidinol dehydrogenase